MEKNRDSLRAWLCAGLFGVLCGLFSIFGYQLENTDRIDLRASSTWLGVLIAALAVTVITRLLYILYEHLTSEGGMLNKSDNSVISVPPAEEKRRFFIYWGIMAVMGLVVLLGVYPGFFVYDAYDELNEVLTKTFSTHHPLLHVLLMGETIAFLHNVIGSWNIAIFVYLFIQMLMITGIYAYVILFLNRYGIGRKKSIAVLIYYGAFPVVVMYSICSCKDGLFSAFLLLLTCMLIRLIREPEVFLSRRRNVVAFIIVAVLVPMFRHNGFYAYLVAVFFLLIYFRRYLKSILPLMLTVPLAFYLLLSSLLGAIFCDEVTHHQEMLTVPIMQLARVYNYESESLSEEEREMIEAYIPAENLAHYTPRVSDMVKVGFNNELYEEDPAGFIRIWLAQFKEHPATYLNAWLLTSYGYVYPPALINVYKGNSVFTITYEESSYFGYETELPGERHSLIPVIDRFYRYISIGSFHDDMPVLYMPFSPGFLVWIYLFVMIYRLYKKRFEGILPFLPMILTLLTVMLGPTYLVRYVLYLWLCAPLLTSHLN
ncbi:MAG: DUF6020 family protein [Lachnospiraceae bacterium]|nr:DUF6020 family protein [Lachnospiraceae bacterium]